VIEGYYPGAYNRTSFGVYMEAYNKSIKELGELYDELDKFLD